MYNHAPTDYVCPICLGVTGIESDQTLIRQSDIVLQNQNLTAFIASYFIGRNDGHLIIVPNQHFENLYDLPEALGAQIFSWSQKLAKVMKEAYGCEGVTVQQNNEPAGGQHAFHYHVHLFPRYQHDEIHAHMNHKRSTTPEERLPFAQKIKTVLESYV